MNRAKLLVCGAALALGAISTAQAQDTSDMSKLTCEQLLTASSDAVEAAIWISGYYNGLRKNTVLNMKQFKHNADVVIAECRTNPKNTVMNTVNTMLSRKK